jgi:UDP:flavonoid glycosyltransferase YjiC (YdhE family)
MKILLVTRGSQGDIYPYLRLAVELKNRGHSITLSVPRMFEKMVKQTGVPFVLQASDDIHGMLEETPDTKNLLEWTQRVIDSQFKELIPLLEKHDLMVSANTEFAAGSIAEYCGKPLIRTAFGPFIPSRKIPPPVLPWPKPHPFFKPAFLWMLLNIGLNLMVRKTLNKNRTALGMEKIKDQAKHAPETAFNFFLYSKYLGNVDNNYNYKWDIGGYCFNDLLPYDKQELERLVGFIKKDKRPTVFFSLGSCNSKHRERFARLLLDICTRHNYKLLVACGWWDLGALLEKNDNLCRMESIIPHCLIFPHCDAIIHHGGAGTTHSAARSGRPQMVVPLLLDQFFWSYRVEELGIGPGGVKINKISGKQLEQKIADLLTNSSYRDKSNFIGVQVRSEDGLDNFCRHVESYNVRTEAEKKLA